MVMDTKAIEASLCENIKEKKAEAEKEQRMPRLMSNSMRIF
jgi:hypothetical protein